MSEDYKTVLLSHQELSYLSAMILGVSRPRPEPLESARVRIRAALNGEVQATATANHYPVGYIE